MRKTPGAIPVPDNNGGKYFSYREAWGRIRKAQGHGFYLEAVTLEESVIADRLISFLVHSGRTGPDTRLEKHSFGQLIKSWSEAVKDPVRTKHFPDLRYAIDEWRKRRNSVVHGMVKSAPGTPHGDILDFLKEAELVALQGDALACALTDWCRSQRNSQRQER